MKEEISQAEFARRKEVSKQTVSKALRNNRIMKTKSGKIDWETQSVAWEHNKAIEKDNDDRGDVSVDQTKLRQKYNEILATNKYYEAKIRELKYKKLQGELISKDEIEQRLLPKLKTITNNIHNLPTRYASRLSSLVKTHIEKKSKNIKYINRLVKKIDKDQLTREIYKEMEADVKRIIKEAKDAEQF